MKRMSASEDASSLMSSASRWWFTLVIFFAYSSYGLAYSLWGSTFQDLQEMLELDGETMKYGLVVKYVGSAIGALTCGFLPDKYSRFHMLLWSLVFMIVSLVATPLFRYYVNFLLMQGLFGIAAGAFDTVSNILTIHLWSTTKYEATAVQALHFIWGVGAFIGPLLAEPFITSDVPILKAGARGQAIVFTKPPLSDSEDNNTLVFENTTDSDVLTSVSRGDDAITDIKHSSLLWPFVITAAISAVGVILILFKSLKQSDNKNNQDVGKSDAAEGKLASAIWRRCH
ncbi:hypothetical protein HDE_09844 [Halotydeus destructor]|nr:hypothetical protein HDE_09844 [Halotydeus destructor]